jgi:hypothetical protein
MHTEIYTLERAEEWDSMLVDAAAHGIFHSMAWARVLNDTYGFLPLYIACRDGNESALLPLMEVRNPCRGRKGVCLPFTDTCGPLSTGPGALVVLDAAVQDLARHRRWRKVEIREDCGFTGYAPSARYYEHVLRLSGGLPAVSRSLRSSTSRNIQKAEREGVEVERQTTKAAIDEYYRLHCISRKRHGVPPQPKSFFDAIHRHVISRGHGEVFRARFDGVTVAAAVFLHHGTRAVYKFAAALPDQARLRPNNLLMWRAISWLLGQGFGELSLGRTDFDDQGLLQFKNGWGAVCREVRYFAFPPMGSTLRKPHPSRARLVRSVVSTLPTPVLRMAGTLAYRHFG